jgi:hypothetical protein
MNINIINAPTILIEEGTKSKAVTLRSIFFFADSEAYWILFSI